MMILTLIFTVFTIINMAFAIGNYNEKDYKSAILSSFAAGVTFATTLHFLIQII